MASSGGVVAWSDPSRTKAGTHCVFVRCLRLLPTVCRKIKTRFGKLIECTCSARMGGCQDTGMEGRRQLVFAGRVAAFALLIDALGTCVPFNYQPPKIQQRGAENRNYQKRTKGQ